MQCTNSITLQHCNSLLYCLFREDGWGEDWVQILDSFSHGLLVRSLSCLIRFRLGSTDLNPLQRPIFLNSNSI